MKVQIHSRFQLYSFSISKRYGSQAHILYHYSLCHLDIGPSKLTPEVSTRWKPPASVDRGIWSTFPAEKKLGRVGVPIRRCFENHASLWKPTKWFSTVNRSKWINRPAGVESWYRPSRIHKKMSSDHPTSLATSLKAHAEGWNGQLHTQIPNLVRFSHHHVPAQPVVMIYTWYTW